MGPGLGTEKDLEYEGQNCTIGNWKKKKIKIEIKLVRNLRKSSSHSVGVCKDTEKDTGGLRRLAVTQYLVITTRHLVGISKRMSNYSNNENATLFFFSSFASDHRFILYFLCFIFLFCNFLPFFFCLLVFSYSVNKQFQRYLYSFPCAK